jgi:hypothetical protein
MKSCATGVNVRVLQCDDPNHAIIRREVDRQNLDGVLPATTKSQNGFRSHREEVPLRDKSDPRNTGGRDHGRARKVKSFRPNTSVNNPWAWSSGGGSAQGSLIRSASFIRRRRAQGFSIPAMVDSTLLRSIESISANLENMHFAEGNPTEDGRRCGRVQYLRAESSMIEERSVDDKGISRANVLIRLEGSTLQPLASYEKKLRSLIQRRGGEIHTRQGVMKQRSYTSYAMTQFAHAHVRAPAPGDKHQFGVVTPQNKTKDWWAMDWMRREGFFLPRYDQSGNILAKGHALASAAGIPFINRRLFHHPSEYGLDARYDFIGYFEFSESDAPVFRAVMHSLRDRTQNPEWDFVREGPEWWGRRVGQPRLQASPSVSMGMEHNMNNGLASQATARAAQVS